MDRLKGKTALITGGAGVIGKETAKRFVAEGAKVALVDLNEEALEKAKNEINSKNIETFGADVSEPGDVINYVNSTVEKFGKIDAFFNNAGIEGAVAPIAEYPVDEFDKVMKINVRGVWLGLKYAIPKMVENGSGSVILSSSVAGLRGTAGVSAYVASKHAIVGIMRTAAMELAPEGIRVNTINPGPVESRMMESLEHGMSSGGDSNETKNMLQQMIPMNRYASPEDVANMALFLASDESEYITGGTFTIDGGMTAS